MKPLIAACLLGAAGLWAWALFWPAPKPEPIPEKWVGTFFIEGFEPPIDTNGERVPMSNPYPPGQTRTFEFGASGTYTLSVVVSGGYEMLRQEGRLEVLEGDVLKMTQKSENRTKLKEPVPPFQWKARWTEDKKGRLIQLIRVLGDDETHLQQGEELYLRPRKEAPAAN